MYCSSAKNLLDTYGVIPEEIRVDQDPAKMQEMRERTGMMSVPQIYIGDEHVGGFTDLKALHDAGTLEGRLE
jgi:glutaredoxin 3